MIDHTIFNKPERTTGIKMTTIRDLKKYALKFKGTRVTTALNFTSRVRMSLGRVHTGSSCERADRQAGRKEVQRAV